jgi:ABC-type uncharacterized transport system involved in gliding motility auxiliary subunit
VITKKLKKFKQTKLWATTINIVLVIVGINIIVQFLPLQLDLTTNKIHTISSETKEIVNQSEDIVTIKAFVSENLPGQLVTVRESLENTLEQYNQAGGSKLKVSWVDPTKDEEAQTEARSLGIQPIRFSSVEQDKFEVTQAYFGLGVFYAGEKEVIPALQEINNLEYRLTSSIKRLQQDELAQIGFSTGNGERTDLQRLKQAMQINYQTTTVDLTDEELEESKLNSLDGLIVAGPNEEFSELSKQRIDQLISNQKGVIMMLDQVKVDQTMQPTPVSLNLNDLLKHYGFDLKNQLVLDQSAALANFQVNQRPVIVSYPLWVKTQPDNRAKDLPPTAALESAVFPWVSPLELSKDAQSLWTSTEQSVVLDEFNNLSPTQQWDFDGDQKQSVLAGVQTNQFSGFYNQEDEENKVKLAVIGDSDFISDNFVQNFPANGQFFMNLIDYLAADIDLISIRSKQTYSRPLKQITDNQKQIYRWASVGFGPALALVISLFIYWQRNKWLDGLKTRLQSA